MSTNSMNDDWKKKIDKPPKSSDELLGLILGAAVGSAIGAATGQFLVAFLVCVGLGWALGLFVKQQRKKNRQP